MTQIRRFFLAIRHRPTGAFLPSVKGYGFTRTAPTHEEAPRLFTKIGPAKQALNYWLDGELFEGNVSDDNTLALRLVRKPERKAEDMEIVEIEMVVRTLVESNLRSL